MEGTETMYRQNLEQHQSAIVQLANEKARLGIELGAQQSRLGALVAEVEAYKRKADEATHEVDDLHVALESEQTWVSEMQRKHESERDDAASLLRQRDATVSRLEERLRQAEANVFEKFQRFFTAEYGGEVSRADEDLGGFLGKIGLSVHHEALEEMGARRISDLIHLEEPDLEQLGMSTLQKRKMMRAVHELRMNQDIICTVM